MCSGVTHMSVLFLRSKSSHKLKMRRWVLFYSRLEQIALYLPDAFILNVFHVKYPQYFPYLRHFVKNSAQRLACYQFVTSAGSQEGEKVILHVLSFSQICTACHFSGFHIHIISCISFFKTYSIFFCTFFTYLTVIFY